MASPTKSAGERPPLGGGTNGAWLFVAVLAAVTTLAYANSFSVPLLFDDWVTILKNPRLRELWPIWSALTPLEMSGVGGRPIANLSFVLNYALTGESVPSFHAVNLAIHTLAGLALFGIVRRTLLRIGADSKLAARANVIGFIVAGWWLLHPVQTQSVTYVSQRTESLMGFFFFSTLYAFIRGVSGATSRGWLVASMVSCFAGMATKEGMVTIPVIVFLYDYAFVSGSLSAAWRARWRIFLSMAASWVLLAFLMSGLHGRGVGFGLGMSWWSYLLTECRAVLHYLTLTYWPTPLVFDYGTDLGNPGVIEVLSAIGITVLGVATMVALWRVPAVGFLAAFFFITVAPTSSVVPIPLQPVSENRVYVPAAAALAGIVIFVQHFLSRRQLVGLMVALVALAALTAARNHDYRSEIAIWSDTVAKRPGSSRAHSNLGQVLFAAGRLAEARSEQEIALQIQPRYAEAHVNLAAILGQMGQIDRAIEHSRKAIEIDPRNGNGYYNLGVGLSQKGNAAEAMAAYETAVSLNDSVEAHGNLALLLLAAGRANEAIAHSEAALRVQPNSVSGLFGLGCGLALTGRQAEAIEKFQAITRLQPTHVDAWRNLGAVLQQTGRSTEAVAVFENGLRINPGQPTLLFGLGNALLGLERFTDAITSYEAALKISPQFADAHQNLGVALGKAGRGQEAVAHLETALRLNPQLKLAAELLDKLKASPVPRKP